MLNNPFSFLSQPFFVLLDGVPLTFVTNALSPLHSLSWFHEGVGLVFSNLLTSSAKTNQFSTGRAISSPLSGGTTLVFCRSFDWHLLAGCLILQIPSPIKINVGTPRDPALGWPQSNYYFKTHIDAEPDCKALHYTLLLQPLWKCQIVKSASAAQANALERT